MERKTKEQILDEKIKNKTFSYPLIIKAMQAYADQEVELAVKDALNDLASLSQEMIYDRKDTQVLESGNGLILRDFQVCYAVPKNTILSLAPQIIQSLKEEKK